MLLLSGQVALDQNGNLVGKDDLAKQTGQAFANIKTIVGNAGGTMANVVKLNYYLADISQIQALRTVRDQFVNTAAPPASTAVQVTKLFRDDILVEIEAMAIIPISK